MMLVGRRKRVEVQPPPKQLLRTSMTVRVRTLPGNVQG